MLVDKISYEQAIKSIRELVLDTNPVQCLKVSGQGFFFKKDSTGITIADKNFSFGQMEKFYDLVGELFGTPNVKYSITEYYVATEPVRTLIDTEFTLGGDDVKGLFRKQYFSQEAIDQAMIEGFPSVAEYFGYPRQMTTIYNELDYFERRRIVLLTAYHLIDRRRMQMATANELIRRTAEMNGESVCGDGEIKNIKSSVTTKVGEVFTITEEIDEKGAGLEGFTDLWGDKYGYLTKLQLYIRGLYEKQFGDYSLRDDAMRSSGFSLEKGWETSAWVDTINFTRSTRDILLPDNRI